MTIYNVDADQVALAASTADQSATAIRTEVAGMMSFLQGLEASWGGTASASFQAVIASWQATQVQVEESLTAISGQLSHAATTYTEAETTASSLFV